MKKTYLLFAIITLMMISCKNDEKKNTIENNTEKIKVEAKEEVVLINDCDCNELENLRNGKKINKSGTKDLFTGKCFEKDQNDSILKMVDIKNGWMIHKVERKKVCKNKYLTFGDLTYDNGEIMDGYTLNYAEDKGIGYVNSYFFRKNGKEVKNKSWKFSLKFSTSIQDYVGVDNEGYDKYETHKGMTLDYSINSNNYQLEDPTNDLTNFDKISIVGQEQYFDKTPTIQERDNVLKWMIKQQPAFEYWKLN